MIQASDVKKYLKIPDEFYDDDNFIASIIQVGYDYLADAIDNYSELYAGVEAFARKADMWVLTQWCPPMFDRREGMFDDPDAGMNYAARAMLTQLQMYKYEEEDVSE